jgi:hypothetical protein
LIVKTTGNYGKGRYLGVAFAIAIAAATMLLLDPQQMARAGHLAMSTTANANENRPMAPQKIMPPARDPEIAVEEEYQIARQRGTPEALQRFIARHPDGPFAEKARADLRRISR